MANFIFFIFVCLIMNALREEEKERKKERKRDSFYLFIYVLYLAKVSLAIIA